MDQPWLLRPNPHRARCTVGAPWRWGLGGGLRVDTYGSYAWLYIGSAAIGLGAVAIALTFRPVRSPPAELLALKTRLRGQAVLVHAIVAAHGKSSRPSLHEHNPQQLATGILAGELGPRAGRRAAA